MVDINNLLERAHSYFSAKQYNKALFLYSQIVAEKPKNKEYKIYCIFCDLGFENSEKAQRLFDYFIVAKEENFDATIKYVEEIVNSYDGDNLLMFHLLQDISTTNIESLNAIEYSDFLELVQTRGSFKEAYEDIMLSTKVAITSKADLVSFINKLIENNFDTTAYSYLDGFNEFFTYDEVLSELYEKLEKKKSAR